MRPGRPGGFLTRRATLRPFFMHIILTVRLFLSDVPLSSRSATLMTEEKTTRELGFTRRTGT